MQIIDVCGDIANLFFLPKRVKRAGRRFAQQFQAGVQAQPCMAVVLRALVAAAVCAVIL